MSAIFTMVVFGVGVCLLHWLSEVECLLSKLPNTDMDSHYNHVFIRRALARIRECCLILAAVTLIAIIMCGR